MINFYLILTTWWQKWLNEFRLVLDSFLIFHFSQTFSPSKFNFFYLKVWVDLGRQNNCHWSAYENQSSVSHVEFSNFGSVIFLCFWYLLISIREIIFQIKKLNNFCAKTFRRNSKKLKWILETWRPLFSEQTSCWSSDEDLASVHFAIKLLFIFPYCIIWNWNCITESLLNFE